MRRRCRFVASRTDGAEPAKNVPNSSGGTGGGQALPMVIPTTVRRTVLREAGQDRHPSNGGRALNLDPTDTHQPRPRHVGTHTDTDLLGGATDPWGWADSKRRKAAEARRR